MALTFNPREAVQKLRDHGMAEPLADATVEVIEDATSPLVTRDYLDIRFETFESRMDARFSRALWIQSGVIIGGVGVIIALVEALG